MVERVNKVEEQTTSIRSNLKTKAYLIVGYKNTELKTEILVEVDRNMIALETCLMHSMNKGRQATATRLQEINDLVAVVRDGQQKMWGALRGLVKISRS